jgi:enoyl-CoA hydratase/carnithine racemase
MMSDLIARNDCFQIENCNGANLLHLVSADGTNRLTRACVLALTDAISKLARHSMPLIVTGNNKFFSVGADLHEIAALNASEAYEFSRIGQALMNAIANHPATTIAAVEGHCMGGGFDLALACHRRIAAPHAVFGHRGAALGLITGWGGTQRLPRLIGKGRALELFVAAEKVTAQRALEIGLVNSIAHNPVADSLQWLRYRAPCDS